MSGRSGPTEAQRRHEVRGAEPRAGRWRDEPGIDVYRGCSVILMFSVHVARLVPPAEPGNAARSLLRVLLWGEPYIAASFLFLAGYSLCLSRERASSVPAWRARTFKRVAWLYGIAIPLFVAQYGVSLPDLVLSPGVLSAIACAIALIVPALTVSRPALATGSLALSVLVVTAVIDGTGVSVSGLNAGPGGAVPLVGFAAFGALARVLVRQHGRGALDHSVAASVALFAVVLSTREPWTTHHPSLYHEYADQLALVGFITGGVATPMRVTFWNHSAIGALGLVSPLLISLWIFTRWPKIWRSTHLLGPLHLLGRHALPAYVLHLLALGVLDAAGLGPPSSVWALAYAAALAAVAALAAGRLESMWARPQALSSTS